MNIAFWSSAHESGVSSCAVAAGIIGSGYLNKRIVLFDNHPRDSAAGRFLLANGWKHSLLHARERAALLGAESGYELMAHMTCKRLSHPNLVITEDHLELNCKNLFLHPIEDEISISEAFLEQSIRTRETDSFTFIDTDIKCNLSTSIILRRAEIVVVILPACLTLIQFFFEHYSSIVDKSIFVLNKSSKYDKDMRDEFCKSFGVPDERIVVIPYNKEFKVAINEGALADFFANNYYCVPGSDNYSLICSFKELLCKITSSEPSQAVFSEVQSSERGSIRSKRKDA